MDFALRIIPLVRQKEHSLRGCMRSEDGKSAFSCEEEDSWSLNATRDHLQMSKHSGMMKRVVYENQSIIQMEMNWQTHKTKQKQTRIYELNGGYQRETMEEGQRELDKGVKTYGNERKLDCWWWVHNRFICRYPSIMFHTWPLYIYYLIFLGVVPVQSVTQRGDLGSEEPYRWSSLAILKFLAVFEERALHFHFALDTSN